MRHLRMMAALLAALGGCVSGGGPEPNLVDGGGSGDMAVGPLVDGNKSTVTVDRMTGVVADGNDKVNVTIKLLDANGNPLAKVPVLVSALGGQTIVAPPLATTDDSGTATATVAATQPGEKTINVLANPGPFEVALAQTPTVDFSAGNPAKLAITIQPASATSGQANPITVQVEDKQGNPVPGATNTINVSILINPAGGTLAGTTSLAAVGGVAAFKDLSIDKAGNGYVLVAQADGLDLATSASFAVMPGPEAKLVFSTQPPSGIAVGATLSPAIVVAVTDVGGNVITSATDGITLSVASGPGNLGGTLKQNAVGGLSTFNDLKLDTNGVYTLAAASGSLMGATSSPFTIGAQVVAAGSRLVFTTQPGPALAGAVIPVTVTAEDALGNAIATMNGPITFSLFTNPGGATLTGGPTVNAVAGVAQLMISIDKAATGYSLAATSSGFAVASSNVFDIFAGAAAKLAFTAQPSTVAAGSSIVPPVVVTVEDAQGNPITGSNAQVTIALANPNGATLSGTLTQTASNGVATFNDLAVDTPGSYFFNASSSPLTAASSTAFTVTNGGAGPSAKLAFTMQPASAVAGAMIPVTVSVEDASGTVVGNATNPITLALFTNPGGGKLTGGATVAAVKGVATFMISVDKAASGYSVVATSPGLGVGVSQAFDIAAGSAAKIAFTTQPSTVAVGAAISPAVVVAVEDSAGNVVPTAASVMMALTNPNGATLGGTLTQPTASGLATFNDLTVNAAGNYSLTATAAGLGMATSISFTVGGSTTGGQKLVFTQQPVSGPSMTTMAITVQVQDGTGAVVTGATNPIALSLFTNPGGAKISGTAQTNAVAGVAQFSISVDKAGTGYSLAATAPGLSPGVSNSFDVTVGSAAQLVFTQQPTKTPANQVMAPPVVVAVADAGGNPVSGAAGMVNLALGNPGGAHLSGTLAQPLINGVATFNDLSVDTNGTYTLNATSGTFMATSQSFAIGATSVVGPATKLVFSAQPASAMAGGAIPVSVSVEDSSGNLVANATNSIALALFTNPGGGKLSGGAAVPAVNGVAQFMISVDKAASGYSLVATATGLQPGLSSSFDISVGKPTQLVFTGQPSNVGTGVTIAPPVAVSIEDASGNVVSGTSAMVTVALAMPNGATLSGTLTQSGMSGIATFNDLKVDTPGAYQLTATATGLGTTTSATFNIGSVIVVGSGTQLAFTQQPGSAAAGAQISVAVSVLDKNGNPTNSGSNPITVALFTNPGGAKLSGTTTVNAVNGVANFMLSVDKVASGYTMVATSPGLTLAVSGSFNISAGAAKQLVFVQQPTSTTAGTSISPAVTVEIQDALGNFVSSANNTVTVALGNAFVMPPPTLAGMTMQMASGGIATFANLSVNISQNGFVLTASAPGLAGATSQAFDITGAAATGITFYAQPFTVTAGTSEFVSFAITDMFGNPTTGGSPITLSYATNPGGAPFPGPSSVAIPPDGVCNVSLIINKAAIGYSLSASYPGLTAATSSLFDIDVGSAAALAFATQPVNTQGGQPITPAPTVQVTDAAGNLVPTATAVSVALTNNSTGATLSGTTNQNSAGGVATFAGLSVDRAGSYTLKATAGALSTQSSFFAIGGGAVGSPSKLVFSTQPAPSTTAGANIIVTVQVQDQNGNVVPGANNPIALSLFTNPNGGTLGGMPTGNASSGIATFTVSVNKVGSGYSLAAASAGLTVGTSAAFAITAGTASQVAFVQQPSNAAPGQTITPPVTVAIEDSAGNVLAGAAGSITLALTVAGGAMLTGGAATPVAAGIATFNGLSVNQAGTYNLTATSGTLTSATSASFSIASSTGSGKQLVFTMQPPNTTGGAPFSVAVQVQDGSGNLVASATNSIMLSIFSNPSGGKLSGTVTQAASMGTANFAGISLDKAGNGYLLVATSNGLQAGLSNSFNVTVGMASQIAFVQQPTNTAPGSTIFPAVTVAIEDAGGNVITTNSTDNITVALGGAGGTLSGFLTRKAFNGVSTFDNLSVNNAGNYTLQATDGAFMATSSAFLVGNGPPGGASKLVFSAQPMSTTGGTTFACTVQVTDNNGNLIGGATNSINISLFTNPGGGKLSGMTQVSASGGSAMFSLSIDKAGTGYALAATATGLNVGVSQAFNITVGGATQLAFVQQPPNSPPATVLAPPIKVAVEDAGGNVVTSSMANVNIALTSAMGATLTGTLAVAAMNGIATFGDLKVNNGGTYSLTASAMAPITSAVSSNFTISAATMAGTPSKLAFAMQPQSTTAGTPMTNITVQVQDAAGNLVSSATNTVSIAMGTGSATLSGTTSAAAVNGVATFSNISVAKAGTGYFLNATSPGLSVGGSASFDIAAGAASKLVFVSQPPNGQAGQPLMPPAAVAVEDSAGNVLPVSDMITLTLNGAGGTLSGGSATASNGIATFNALSVSANGTYTVTAHDGAFMATSSSFTISTSMVMNGNKLVFSTEPISTQADLRQNVVVQVQDSNGNVVTTASNPITLALFTNPGGVPPINLTVNAVMGVATFSNLQFIRVAQGYSLVATTAGLQPVVSTAFDISPGKPAALQFTLTPGNAVAGQAIAPAPTVQVNDSVGNFVPTASGITVTLTLGNNNNGATLSGMTMQPVMNGQVSFPGLSIDKQPQGNGTYFFSAAAPGLGSAQSGMFSLQAGPATQLAFTQQPMSGIAGINEMVRVNLEDMFGNIEINGNGNVVFTLMQGATVVGSQNAPMFSGQAQINQQINQAGTYTLTAALTGFTTVTSNSFTVGPGMATKLIFVQQPSNVQVNMPIVPAVTVAISDSFNNVVTTASNMINLTLMGPGGALGGTFMNVPTSNGVASFSNLTVSMAGFGYRLQASAMSGGIPMQQSLNFVVSNAAPLPASKLFISSFFSLTQAGMPMSWQVQLQDSMGNLVANASNLVTLTPAPSAVTTGNIVNVAPQNGTANFNWAIDTAGMFNVTASATGLTSTSQMVTIQAGFAAGIGFSVQPTTTQVASPWFGGAGTPAITEVDAFGNPTTNGTFCRNVNITVKGNSALVLSPVNGSTMFNLCSTTQLGGIAIDRTGMFQLVATDVGGSGPGQTLSPGTSSTFTVNAGAWSQSSVGLDGGDILALAIDPKTPATIYAGTAGNGLYKSTNGGTSWAASNNLLGSPDVVSIAIHPTTTSTLFVGTDSGVFRSTDSGASWTQLVMPNTTPININFNNSVPSGGFYVAIPPTSPSTVYEFNTRSGAGSSFDGGNSWQPFGTGNPMGPSSYAGWAVAVSPFDPTLVYFAGQQGSSGTPGLFSIGSKGQVNPLSSVTGMPVAIALDPITNGTAYVASSTGVFKSTDGTNFAPANSGLTNANVQAIVLNPTTPATLFTSGLYDSAVGVASVGFYRSVDSATSWQKLTTGPVSTRIVHAIAADGTAANAVYAGIQYGGGVYKSSDGGSTFASSMSGLEAANVQSMAIVSASSIYAAAEGVGIYHSANGGASWSLTAGQPASAYIRQVAVAPSSATQLYASDELGATHFSSNGGTSWTQSTTSPGSRITAFAVHPTTATTVYAGGDGDIYESVDGGNHYIALSSGIANVTGIGFDRATANTLYVTHGGGFSVGAFNGAMPVGMQWTWTSRSMGLPPGALFSFVQSPSAANEFFAGGSNQISKSTNLTTGWSPTNPVGSGGGGNGPTFDFQTMLFEPTIVGALYGGGGLVLKSLDDAATWIYAASGMPNPQVKILIHDPATSNVLWAGSSAGGVWKTTTGGQ